MDGGLFGFDATDIGRALTGVKSKAVDTVMDQITKRGDLAPEVSDQLRKLMGAGRVSTVRDVLASYRRVLAHGAEYEMIGVEGRRRGEKATPLTREQLIVSLGLVGLFRKWKSERWTKAALRKLLNARLRQLFSKRTGRSQLLQLLAKLDGFRKETRKLNRADRAAGQHRGRWKPLKKTVRVEMEEENESRPYFKKHKARARARIPTSDYFADYADDAAYDTRVADTAFASIKPRKKRKPSIYNIFMGKMIRQIRQESPDVSVSDAMQVVARDMWPRFKQSAEYADAVREHRTGSAQADAAGSDSSEGIYLSDPGDAAADSSDEDDDATLPVPAPAKAWITKQGVMPALRAWVAEFQPKYAGKTPIPAMDLAVALHNRAKYWAGTKKYRALAKGFISRLKNNKMNSRSDTDMMDLLLTWLTQKRKLPKKKRKIRKSARGAGWDIVF